jgi:hypothetical protein
MTSEKIKNYCEEALTISKEQGMRDGLTFLIGEKLSLIYFQLKTERNKLKFLYSDNLSKNKEDHALIQNKSLQLSYTLTINENYREVFEQVNYLEKVLNLFINEIKASFPDKSIQDYLSSFPRLTFKEDFSVESTDFLKEIFSMTTQDIFSEVEDILIVDEMHSLFTE